MAMKFCKLAHDQQLPFIADVVCDPTGPDRIQVLHYDFRDDLSYSEKALVRSIMRDAARVIPAKVGDTTYQLEYVLT